MATLILSGVGRLVAGQLGGAVGAVLDNALDHRLLGPKTRQGARLSDLAVQASEYGTMLPKLFGRTRVAGTVIWATDLRETRTQVSQGKGRPKTDTYIYSVSFAVALSARPILRVTASIIEGGSVRLSLVAHGSSAVAGSVSDPGRGVGEPDLAAGETILAVIDLPPLGTVGTSAMVAVLANGTGAGWRRAALTISRDGGASWDDIGGTALPATIGVVTSVLPVAASRVIDRVNSVDVMLAHSGLTLTDADHAGLASGANLAMLGDEALQFGRAEPLGGGVWRLSELWRGRCGTEYAMGGHVAGETFAMIAGAEMRLLSPEDAIAGALVGAQGVGDGVAVQSPVTSADRALRPLSPVTLHAAAVTGGILIRWTRRSRDGFLWRDGVDAPLAEEREAYRVDSSGGGAVISAEVDAAEWLLPTGFASPGTGVNVTVRQIGRAGLSDPATISVTI